jgi:RNA polymerase sigma factor (sigma-70 family)
MAVDSLSGEQPGLYALLRAARRGDRAAHDALLVALRLPIRRFLRGRFRVGADPEMALEDIEQEALLHVHCHLGDCRATSDGSLLSWVLMVARRAALDVIREPLESSGVRSPGLLASLADEESLQEREDVPIRVRLLVDAQRWLSARDQELLWRRLVSNESWAEVGASLGLSWTAARRRFQRAQRLLRRHGL